MKRILNFLFPDKPNREDISLLLLGFRILFGVLLMTHGIQKLSNFSELSTTFPDPLNVGSQISLGLAIFGELACSLGFIFGALYRLALIPMIFTMGMAFFVIHSNDPWATRELAFVYGVVYILMFIAGPGKYALDRFGVSMLKNKLP